MSLATAPYGQLAVFSPHGGRRVGLDVALVNRGGAEISFDNYIRLFESFVDVTQFEEEVIGDVSAFHGVIFVQ